METTEPGLVVVTGSAAGFAQEIQAGPHRLAADEPAGVGTVTVRLRHARIHAQDCADCETKQGLLDHVDRELVLEGELSEEQRARLLEIANKCPVHRTLTSEVKVETRLV
jgi:putative redox protein